MKDTFINIAVPSSVRRLFTYRLPSKFDGKLQLGQRCIVPFGRRQVIGYFIETTDNIPGAKIKPISEILEPYSLFNKELSGFLKWMSDYYFCNIADVFNSAIPPALRKIKKTNMRGAESLKPGVLLGYKINETVDSEVKSQLSTLYTDNHLIQKNDILENGITNYRLNKWIKNDYLKPVYGLPDLFDYFQPRTDVEKIKPNTEQERAIKRIIEKSDKFNPFLLYGITGSGKTLVYCHTAREILKTGKSVLVLVPEIALAGNLLSYFKSFFNDKIALLHSGLKPKERLLIWQNIKNGTYKIVIGARSAIFAPLDNLGLIIVDEEHDESYKQDDPAPRFQGRDAAVMRAKMAKIPVVLGSATPSIESFFNAESGRYELLKLTRRPEEAEIPLVRVIDLKQEYRSINEGVFFTKTMVSKIKQSLKKNNQVILFLNRRGFSPRIKCADCGYSPECPHCNISLAYHKKGHRLICHFCGHINSQYNSCSQCKGDDFIYVGVGTQKIEDTLERLIDDAQTIRLDSDSAAVRNRAHNILSDFAAGKYNILLGTQMVAKGIDFPTVSLVGVMMADIGLDMPDFRASEKLFAKLIQVAGRSGRGIIPGEVVIQTFRPQLDLIDDAARQDYDTYYYREILSRKQLHYPPYSHLINFRFAGKTEKTILKAANDFRTSLDAKVKEHNLSVHILGPAPCPLYRLRGMYRRQLMVKTKQIIKFIKFLNDWENTDPNFGLSSSVRLATDIDPYDMM